MLDLDTAGGGVMHANAIPSVGQHPHDVPRRALVHLVVGLIDGAETHFDALFIGEPFDGDFEFPVAPAPVSRFVARAKVGPARFLADVDVSELPAETSVEGELATDHLASAATVGVSLEGVRLLSHRNDFVGRRVRDGAVNVELVDDVFRLEPPAFLGRGLRVNVRRQDSVVVEVVKVVALAIGDFNFGEKLNHTTANVTGDDDSHGETVVRMKFGAVLLKGDEHVTRRIERGLHVDGRAVGSWSTVLIGVILRELVLRAAEADVARARAGLVNAGAVEEQTKRNTSPVRVPDRTRSPREADGRLDEVLLLSSVTGADDETRKRIRRHLGQLVHTNVKRLGHVAAHVNRVRVPLALRNRTVITHNV